MPTSKLFTINEIAEKYEVLPKTVRKWLTNGLEYLPGKPYRIKVEWVESYIENSKRSIQPKAKKKYPNVRVLAKPVYREDMKIRLEDII